MTKFIETEAKSILQKYKFRDDWFWNRYGVNPYRGCQFACNYCDAITEKYLVHESYKDFSRIIYVKKNAPEVLGKEVKKRIDFLNSSFRIASISIFGDTRTGGDLKRIYMESCYAGRNLIEVSAELSNLLSNEDAAECQKKAIEFDDFFKKAMNSENYGQYINTMTKFIIELKHLLDRIGEKHNIKQE